MYGSVRAGSCAAVRVCIYVGIYGSVYLCVYGLRESARVMCKRVREVFVCWCPQRVAM